MANDKKDAGNNGGTTSSSSSSRETSQKPADEQSPSATAYYLIFYNLISNVLWMTLTQRLVVSLLNLGGGEDQDGGVSGIFDDLFPSLSLVQSVALLEVVHSLLGLVRASVVTTTMQVASRVIVVWGVMYTFSAQQMGYNGILGEGKGGVASSGSLWPQQGPPGDWAFVGCLIAWGLTECVRYGFFVLQLSGKGVPGPLVWLRYNMFFVLYPLGISCECTLWYLAIKPAELIHPYLPWLFMTILVVYVPGSYVLYTHMMAQRRKVMRAEKRAD